MKGKILIIEDNEANIYLISFILKKYGYSVIEARNGEEGVVCAINEHPELILMDIDLPKLDGYEVTRMIRALETKGRIIPVIALTSYAMAGDKKKAIEAGCTGYMEKPINPDTFMTEIEKYLNHTKL